MSTTTNESMKQIPGFPGYAITEDGRIWSGCHKGAYLTISLGRDGDQRVHLYRNKKRYTRAVHKLVLEAYIGPCPKDMVGQHKDGNLTNNKRSNLKWGTRGEIQDARVERGVHVALGKYDEDHFASKLSNQERRMIHSRYRARGCTQRGLAAQFGVTQPTICRIVHESRWLAASGSEALCVRLTADRKRSG